MGGFSDPSDTDDSEVGQILSEAKDACVLEQIAAINCSGVTDSVLPSELESRFRRLKSFPVTKFNLRSSSGLNSNTGLDDSAKGKADADSDGKGFDFSTFKQTPDEKMSPEPKLLPRCVSSPTDHMDFREKNVSFPPVEVKSDGKKALKAKSLSGFVASPSGSSVPSRESSLSPPIKQKSDSIKGSKLKSKSGFISSPLSFSDSVWDSPSPPRRAGCFWCSPKRDSKKKNKENWASGLDFDLEKSDDLLSDLGTFSVKKQQKLLKKAMKEEEMMSREAEKTLELAKQASAKMKFAYSDDDLSE